MATNSLDHFTTNIRNMWGPLTSELAAAARRQMETLLRASPKENWLAELRRTASASQELYRDPDHGFVLLAHGEQAGLYRPPHDHGRSWVVYGIQDGEVEMSSYALVETPNGNQLVQRDQVVLRPGDARVYLPGDVHDTRCLTDTALLFRFTERDLRVEDRQFHRVTRFVREAGVWAPPAL